MEKLIYGKNKQLKFSDCEEKYKSIGFICNDSNCSISIEDNASRGSYSDAYRIRVINKNKITLALKNALRSSGRINCNEFVKDLIDNYGFYSEDGLHVYGLYHECLNKIPPEYICDFNGGYNL